MDERGSVPECASPLALSTRGPHAEPNAVFFRILVPARAAEDCRTPGPFGVHRSQGISDRPSDPPRSSAATWMSAKTVGHAQPNCIATESVFPLTCDGTWVGPTWEAKAQSHVLGSARGNSNGGSSQAVQVEARPE